MPGGLTTSISCEQPVFSVLWHLFGSALGRSSGDEVPEPACIPKPTGGLGLMTDTNPLPPEIPFCQPSFLTNSLCMLEGSKC